MCFQVALIVSFQKMHVVGSWTWSEIKKSGLQSIASPRLKPCDSVQDLGRVILSLIFPRNKTIDHNKCVS